MTAESVRVLAADEVATLIAWAAAEGWNPGLDDAAAFRAADPDGFLGIADDKGLASAIAAVRFGAGFGFIGLYITRPDRRGEGLGRRVWNAALHRLAGRTIGLDGVPERQADYAREGFVLAHRNVRYAGSAPAGAGDCDALVAVGPDSPPELIRAIVRFDSAHVPIPRPDFIRGWVAGARRRTLVCLRGGDVAGLGVIRACVQGHKIGPLFANAPDIAQRLFSGLCTMTDGGPVSLDIPGPNGAAIAMAERAGLKPGFETARMYRGGAPELALDGVFGITTLELG